MTQPRIKQASLYLKTDTKIICRTCQRNCQIPQGELGFCQTRKNIDGKLYTLEYGDISTISANPIEKKPFFHFYPGSKALTVGSWSCNFTCPWCQNYDISKSPQSIGKGNYISPEKFIQLVKEYDCQGTSISFNEPTLLLEYALDVFPLAKAEGYYNTFVTNGYMTAEALKLLAEHGLDAMNIDIKGGAETSSRFCSADVDKVWQNAIEAKRLGIWIEITTLVIPGVNDKDDELRNIANRIKIELGSATPWHVTGYYPAYKFRDELFAPPTPITTLEKARNMGKDIGLNYVYLGNVLGSPYENTYCPNCNELLIERYGFSLTKCRIASNKRCYFCGEEIPIIGALPPVSYPLVR